MKMRKLTAFAAAAAMLMSCPIPSAQAEDQVFMHDTFESGTDSWTGRGAASAAASSDFSCEGSSSLSVTGRTAASSPLVSSSQRPCAAGFRIPRNRGLAVYTERRVRARRFYYVQEVHGHRNRTDDQ